MKKIFNLELTTIIILGVTIFASCSKDNNISTDSTRTLTISCGIGITNSKTDTRAGVTPNNPDKTKETFIWHEGDKFEAWLMDPNNYNDYFETPTPVFTIDNNYSNTTPSRSASFTCADFPTDRDYEITAVYPQGKFSVYQAALSNTEISSTQTQVGNSTKHLAENMFMYASANILQGSTSTNLTFKHITSLFRFSVNNKNDKDCKLMKIEISSSSKIFGTKWTLLYNKIYNDQNTQNLALLTNTSEIETGIEIKAGDLFNGYMITGLNENNELTNQTLTFTLTVTDVDGTNQREYTSMALDANKIIAANNGVTTWEPGKRYWFNLVLNDKLTVTIANITAMPGWDNETDL